MIDEAKNFYKENLKTSSIPKLYLDKRNVNKDIISKFEIGYANNQNNDLFNFDQIAKIQTSAFAEWKDCLSLWINSIQNICQFEQKGFEETLSDYIFSTSEPKPETETKTESETEDIEKRPSKRFLDANIFTDVCCFGKEPNEKQYALDYENEMKIVFAVLENMLRLFVLNTGFNQTQKNNIYGWLKNVQILDENNNTWKKLRKGSTLFQANPYFLFHEKGQENQHRTVTPQNPFFLFFDPIS